MTEQKTREKICEIIAPYVSAWGDDTAIANALIAAGYGDVKEAEAEANRYEMLYKMQSRDMALAERKAYESEHRAEVAEKAGRIIQRDMARVFDVSNPRVCELIANIWDLAKKQAEKELAEEKKSD